MSELPFGKTITLCYIPNILTSILNVREFEGMYATAQDAPNHTVEVAAIPGPVGDYRKWQLVSKARGVEIQFSSEWGPIHETTSVGVGAAWHNSTLLPGARVLLSGLKDASTYYVNVVVKTGGGWVITISPMGNLVGLDLYVVVSDDEKLKLIGPPVDGQTTFPGWFLQEAD